jgi:hypothetical protein
MTQLTNPMPEDEIDIQEAQTAPLRRIGADESSVIISITDAIHAAGLGDGGSFRFVPGAAEELGMVPALGSEQEADGRSEQLTRPIYHEGEGGKTLRLIIPPAVLREIADSDSIDWEDPPEVNVWVGDRMLAFELAESEECTVEIDRDVDVEAGEEGEGQ